MRPQDGDTVGVGMPIILRFSADVALEHRLQLVDHIRVTSVPAVLGAWHWFAPNEVHWRPASYWSPGTQVAVTADLDGVPAGGGVLGQDRWWRTFTVGPRHVSIVDTVTHRMQVFDGDRPVNTWPLSAGRSDLQTINGTLYVRYKVQDVLMDSTTIGIPRDAWDGYYEHVYWNTAISTDGSPLWPSPRSAPSSPSRCTTSPTPRSSGTWGAPRSTRWPSRRRCCRSSPGWPSSCRPPRRPR